MRIAELETNELRELEAASQILNSVVGLCEKLHYDFGLIVALRLKQVVSKEMSRIREAAESTEVVA